MQPGKKVSNSWLEIPPFRLDPLAILSGGEGQIQVRWDLDDDGLYEFSGVDPEAVTFSEPGFDTPVGPNGFTASPCRLNANSPFLVHEAPYGGLVARVGGSRSSTWVSAG